MDKIQNMDKQFSSTINNRKNYDSVLEQHPCLLTNQLEQDHNGARIVAVCRLLKSSLRLKTVTYVCCVKAGNFLFLTEEEWKSVGSFDAHPS